MTSWAKQIGSQPFIYLTSMDLDHELLPRTWKAKLI